MSLFSTIARVNLSPDEKPIPIHVIKALAGEISRGSITVEESIALLELPAEMHADWIRFLTAMGSAVDKVDLSMRVFDWLLLAEQQINTAKYHDETQFWLMVENG